MSHFENKTEKVGNTMTDLLNEIVALARENKDESWKEIDKILPQRTNQQEFFDWAKENIKNIDSGLRDLAASIFEQTDLKLDGDIIKNLFELMGEIDKENPYPSFRAACALAKRREDEIVIEGIEKIRSKLQRFVEDGAVSEIAKGYLQKVE